MKPKLVYLASPYSHGSEHVREERYAAAMSVVAYALRMGSQYIVYSPIVHNHVIANKFKFPGTFGFWERADIEILLRCDLMWILRIPGWMESKGIKLEEKAARKSRIPVEYIDPVT